MSSILNSQLTLISIGCHEKKCKNMFWYHLFLRWQFARMSLIFFPHQVVFEGVVGRGYMGDIAIDDVTTTPGPCSLPGMTFYAPGSNDRGHIVFVLSVCLFVCLFVCLSVVNFNLRYNFWTKRDRDFIFGMHTPLMTPFQMTPRSMTLWPWLWPWS